MRVFSRPIWLVVSVAAVLAYEYFLNVDLPSFTYSSGLHQEILNGTAESPFRYRILVPYLAEIVIRLASAFTTYERAFYFAYALYDLVALEILLVGLYLWLREWFDLPRAMIGTLFIAGVMPVTFHDHFFQPWSLLEVGLFALALVCIRRGYGWRVTALVVVASLTRETAIFIPIAHALTRLPSPTRSGVRTALRDRGMLVPVSGAVLSTLIFAGLRLALGSAPHMDLLSRFPVNFDPTNLRHAAINLSLFLGFGWLAVVRGYHLSPRFPRRLTLLAVPYGAVIFVHGTWYEARHLMFMYPVFAALLLFGVRWPGTPEQSVGHVEPDGVGEPVAERTPEPARSGGG
jgi:hypothetical protein